MSRQAQICTDIVVKDEESLREAVLAAVQELGGKFISKVKYYAGEVLGIQSGYTQIGVIIDKKGKLTFVGEDIQLNSTAGIKIQNLIKQGYNAIQVSKALGLMGYRVTPSRQEKALKFVGVR